MFRLGISLIKHEHRGYCVILLKMHKALDEYKDFYFSEYSK